jgi:hypothetical protein
MNQPIVRPRAFDYTRINFNGSPPEHLPDDLQLKSILEPRDEMRNLQRKKRVPPT